MKTRMYATPAVKGLMSYSALSAPMIWVYDDYNLYSSFSVGTVARRQDLTYLDVRSLRL